MPINKVFKTRMRWERAARMEAMCCSDADIALAIGISLPGLATLKQSNEYRQIRLQIATGILTDIDADIADETQNLRDRLKEQVPIALQAIADLVAAKIGDKPNDPKLRLQAAESILDRDGRFMKASRTVVSDPSDLPAYMSDKDTDTVNRIIATQQPVVPVVAKTKDGETIQ